MTVGDGGHELFCSADQLARLAKPALAGTCDIFKSMESCRADVAYTGSFAAIEIDPACSRPGAWVLAAH